MEKTARFPVPDASLLERFIHTRDQEAFAEIVRRHRGVCQRMLGKDSAAAAVFQATFLVLSRKAASVRKAQSLASWLHGVALRIALKERYSAGRRRSHERQAAMTQQEPVRAASVVEPRILKLQRLAALVPRPRLHLIRFHGVLAPNARLRPHIIPNVPVNANTPSADHAECPLPRRLPP